jgi:hypothetical protein
MLRTTGAGRRRVRPAPSLRGAGRTAGIAPSAHAPTANPRRAHAGGRRASCASPSRRREKEERSSRRNYGVLIPRVQPCTVSANLTLGDPAPNPRRPPRPSSPASGVCSVPVPSTPMPNRARRLMLPAHHAEPTRPAQGQRRHGRRWSDDRHAGVRTSLRFDPPFRRGSRTRPGRDLGVRVSGRAAVPPGRAGPPLLEHVRLQQQPQYADTRIGVEGEHRLDRQGPGSLRLSDGLYGRMDRRGPGRHVARLRQEPG